MIAREAKRAVFRAVAAIIEGELIFDEKRGTPGVPSTEWLRTDDEGPLPPEDHARMRSAAEHLAAELRRRAQGTW